jgi:hypothetical protein
VTFSHLRNIQDIMLRACVRNMMFFATLPYYLVGEMPRSSAPAAGDRHRTVSERPHHARRRDDVRWLR